MCNLAVAYAHVGEDGTARHWLQQALQLNLSLAPEAQQDEDFKGLFLDPEFFEGLPR